MTFAAKLSVTDGIDQTVFPEDLGLLSVPSRSHSRAGTPSPRHLRKKGSTQRGQAGFGSSVINLANTILGAWFQLGTCADARCWDISHAGCNVRHGSLYGGVRDRVCGKHFWNGVVFSLAMCVAY